MINDETGFISNEIHWGSNKYYTYKVETSNS